MICADPDPVTKKNADPDPQPCFIHIILYYYTIALLLCNCSRFKQPSEKGFIKSHTHRFGPYCTSKELVSCKGKDCQNLTKILM